jgi:hypothetical protein
MLGWSHGPGGADRPAAAVRGVTDCACVGGFGREMCSEGIWGVADGRWMVRGIWFVGWGLRGAVGDSVPGLGHVGCGIFGICGCFCEGVREHVPREFSPRAFQEAGYVGAQLSSLTSEPSTLDNATEA